MRDAVAPPTYAGCHVPPGIIAHAVWLHFRFTLRYRDVEGLLAERGVIVTDETIRRWCRKFGQVYADTLRRRRRRPGDKWHLDEVFIRINGRQRYLWRAVDRDGEVLDILVQSRRDKDAATECFRTPLEGSRYVPRVLITDKLASYSAAHREVLPGAEHRRHKGLTNRAEHAHQPTRERERRMRRFKDPGHAQRFLAASGPIARTSARAVTASPPRTTARPAPSASPPGGRSPAPRPWPERRRLPRFGQPWYRPGGPPHPQVDNAPRTADVVADAAPRRLTAPGHGSWGAARCRAIPATLAE